MPRFTFTTIFAGPALLMCTAALPGCQERAHPAAQRDSAGIRVVMNAAIPPGGVGQYSLAVSPAVQIGSINGADATLFSGIRHAAVLGDRRILIANGQPLEVRVFGADGVFERRFGRFGQGPGEFLSFTGIRVLSGDTLAIQNGTIGEHLYTGAGTYVRSLAGPAQGETNAWQPLDQHRVLIGRNVSAPSSEGHYRPSTRYVARTRFGAAEAADTIGVFAGVGHFRLAGPPALPPFMVPFSGRSHVAVAPDVVYVSHHAQYEIAAYSFDGSLKMLIRLQHTPLTVTAAHRAAATERLKDNVLFRTLPSLRTRLDQQLAAMQWPAVHPAIETIFVDRLGFIWARNATHPGADSQTWHVFDKQGIVVAQLQLPGGLSVLDIGRDYLLALYKNGDGVEFVHRYALARGE